MASNSVLNAYTNNALELEVNSASAHKLVLMLFEGAIAALGRAKLHMTANRIPEKGKNISHAISIIDGGLRRSLDKNVGGELAANLDSLYEYMGFRLLSANLENRVDYIDEVVGLLTQIRDAWREISNTAPNAANVEVPPPVASRPATSYGKA